MSGSRNIPIPLAPGVVLNKTEYEAQGRYIDCDKVRFRDGLPEKMAGWEQWNIDGDELPDVCRTIFCWNDFSYNVWHAFGTSHRLWVFDQEKARTNITPFVSSGTLTDPFSTTDTLAVVAVADTAHGLVVGQYVTFDNATAVGGITIDGEYQVTGVVDADNYEITHTSAATSTAGPGGGSVDYDYELEAGTTIVTTGGGWGLGRYGEGTWGTERASVTYVTFPRYWSLDKYGQYLIALPSGGTVYQWQLDIIARAAAVTNAPTGQFAFITSERMIVVLGADDDLMTVAWCDDDDITVWTPAATNSANVRKLQEGSRLIAGARLAQQINVIWSDTSIFLMQYLGNNTVYSTRVIASNCGLLAPGAFCVENSITYWMSNHTFYLYNGGVMEIPNSADVQPIFDLMNSEQRSKVTCFYNPKHNEVWWCYPSTSADEPDSYIAVCLDDYAWTKGTMDRTAWGTTLVATVQTVLAVDSAGTIYEHEIGVDADGAAMAWHVETAYFDMDAGNNSFDIDGYIPDFTEMAGTITLDFTALDTPRGDTIDTTSKTITEARTIVDLRVGGRQAKFRLSQEEVGGDFRLGAPRLEVRRRGKRRAGTNA